MILTMELIPTKCKGMGLARGRGCVARALFPDNCGDGRSSAWRRVSTLEAAEFEVVILKDGQRVTGEIVAEKPNALLRRPGLRHSADSARPDLAASQGRRVAARARRSPARGAELDTSGFYTTGVLKPSPVKELVGKFGEAVISIETPSGKGRVSSSTRRATRSPTPT